MKSPNYSICSKVGTHSTKYFIPLIVLVLLLIIACSPKKYTLGKNDEATIKALTTMYDNILDEIDVVYKEKNWRAHSDKTIKAIKFLNLYPNYILIKIDAPLRERVYKGNILPYLSLVLEYTYRLQRAPTKKTSARFSEIVAYFNKYKSNLISKKAVKKDKSSSAILRTIYNKPSYRMYSTNVVVASSVLQLSGFGKMKIQNGYKPEYFARLVELLENCRSSGQLEEDFNSEISPSEYVENNNPCLGLYAYLYDKLTEAGMDPSAGLDDITSLIGSGYTGSTRDCFNFLMDDEFTNMINDLEDYLSCMEGQANYRPDGMTTDIFGNLMIGSGSADMNDQDWRDYLTSNGYEITNDENSIISDFDIPGAEGLEFVGFSTLEGTNSNDSSDTITVETTTHFTNEHWGEVTGTYIKHENSEGKTETWYRGSPSNSTASKTRWTGSGSNAGASYEAAFDENGKLESETIVDEDGTVTEVTYDDEGNIESETVTTPSGTASQPPDEFGNEPPCSRFNNDEVREEAQGNVSKLDTLIIPNPNSIEPSDNPCFNLFSNNDLSNCQSVALCLEGNMLETATPGTCDCQDSDFSFTQPGHSGYAINCGPDSDFDPATGVCKGRGSMGSFTPGVGIAPFTQLPIQLPPNVGGLDDIKEGVRNHGDVFFPR